MGTCIPAHILDEHGCITSSQTSIERLSLVTDGTCPQAGSRLEGLDKLKNLKHLAWQGVSDTREVTALCQCIVENLVRLKTLQLSFGSGSMYARDLRHGLNGFELAISECAIKLFALQSLSLSNFAFTRKYEMTAQAFNVAGLRYLTLRGCAYQLAFLQSLAQSRQPLNLKSFELCFDGIQEPDIANPHAVVEFLTSFSGLEYLHLLVSNTFISTHWFRDLILHHRRSLKSLIYHERDLISIDTERLFEETRDVATSWAADIPRILQQCDLKFLGLCLNLSSAVS